MGASTWSTTNTTPTRARGPARLLPDSTAPMSTPMAMANTAGSAPRRMSTTHQAAANGASAFGRTLKNFHSWRSLSRLSTRCTPTLAGPQLHLGCGQRHLHELGRHAAPGLDDLVDDAVLLGLLGGHEEVAIDIGLHLLQWLAAVVGDDL